MRARETQATQKSKAHNRPSLRLRAALPWLCLLVAASGVSRAQISPGPLSRAHQSLSGVTQCTSCHNLGSGGGGGALKCLECHTEIAQRLKVNQGFHAGVVKHDNPNKDCVRCHSEHNGEDFRLIHWEPSQEKFDHNKAGYPLDGKHAGLECRQCHNSTRIDAQFRPLIREKDLNRSFLGLARACASCHRDFHEGRLGKECQTCHNTSNWKDTTKFDHSRTRYPLTGEHIRVACAKCHTPAEPGGAPRFTGLKFSTCAACHADPHHGAFQKDCSSCHSTAGWKQLSSAGLSSQFDHDKTAYPLRGKHSAVNCLVCHRNGNFKAPVPHALCADCHKPDPHSGQFARRKDGGKCESCHNVEGFKPSTYTVKDHATSGFPLEAAHAKTECAKCHLPAGAATKFKIKFALCLDCHKDAHQGQFAAAPLLNRCESCHNISAFSPSTYTMARHKQTRFPLTDGHIAVPCADCHAAKKQDFNAAVPYHFKDVTCTTCHEDVHKGQFQRFTSKARPDGRVLGCEACHNLKDWADMTKFDHDRQTTFVLIGAHKGTACIQCHKPENLETTMRHVSFKSAPSECEGCHDDPHARQFARDGRNPGCKSCHNTNKWKPSTFDHEQTVFSLRGAHQDVKCNACHKEIREVEGKRTLFYRPVPKECADCHGPRVNAK
ncbi:MAG: hypothetical protein LAP21_28635 [Acidobacteriia bacterium]|nr:hypothetical protein [Terriglobia bacterium]